MFRRLLKYRSEPDTVVQQQNTHFPTARIPISASVNRRPNYPLADSTNTNMSNNMCGAFRMAVNPCKLNNDHSYESSF
jgi:hypothetical protein